MNVNEQVKIMEWQIHSEHANFLLWEKMQYLNEYFKNDPDYSKEAIDIVIANCSKQIKRRD